MPIIIRHRDGAQKFIGAAAKDKRFHYSDPVEQPLMRLLHLLPDTDAASPLKGYIQTSTLETINTPNSKFEALSYTWDSQVKKERLIVQEDAYIEIGSNLAAFLRQRRCPKETVVLWVDAICIDQQNIDERNALVSVMHLSYLFSKSLSIWLGPEYAHSACAISGLVMLGSLHVYETVPTMPLHICQAIQSLLQRPWWKRVWIVQELCYGGCSLKDLSDEAVTVRCGEHSISWRTLVIACAKLYLNKKKLPCSIPEIDQVLLLDSSRANLLRASPLEIEGKVHQTVLRLVIEHRQCNATDPRDKIYGLLGLAISLKTIEKEGSAYRVEYKDSIRTVYSRFAAKMVEKSLVFELLKECGGAAGFESTLGMPSWIPDWSLKRRDIALPDSNREKDQIVPWWAVPHVSYPKPGIVDVRHPIYPESAREEMESILHNTQITSGSKAADQSNVEPVRSLSPDDPRLYTFRTPTGRYNALSSFKNAQEMAQTNIEEELAMQKWFLRLWLDRAEDKRAKYAAGGDKREDLTINSTTEELEIAGVVWDSVAKTAQDVFPEDLESNWEASTYYMINVGRCRQLALQTTRVWPYVSEEDRDSAFWDTLVVGQDTGLITPYHHFLPPIPETWEMAEPPLIHSRPYHAEWADVKTLVGPEIGVEERGARYLGAFDELHKSPLAGMSEEDAERRKARWQELGNLWSTQPYDLYHRPFILPHTVPDPYWNSRVKLDEVAKALSYRSREMKGYFGKDSNDDPSEKKVCVIRAHLRDRLKEHPSIVPPMPNEFDHFGLEKYALGRRFFVTQQGYFGIGPAEAQPGDQVVIFPGAQVPMILRRVRPGKYKVVGETYVSGIMKGEVMTKVSKGEYKVETVTLV